VLVAMGCHYESEARMVRMDDPPKQFCPECGFELDHEDSNTAKTGHEGDLELFDYYECPNGHGKFQYRRADRILRKVIA
jgi:hypothetical protein